MELDYYYKTYFEKYNICEDENEKLKYKNNVIGILKEVVWELQYLKDSKINFKKKYYETIERLKRNRDELQFYSTQEIHLKLPQHPSYIYHFMDMFLSRMKIKDDDIISAFFGMYSEIFGTLKDEQKRQPKKTKGVKEWEASLYTAFGEARDRLERIRKEEPERYEEMKKRAEENKEVKKRYTNSTK